MSASSRVEQTLEGYAIPAAWRSLTDCRPLSQDPLGGPERLSLVFFVLAWIAFVKVEEPRLERRVGEDYRRYKANVPRWVPQATPRACLERRLSAFRLSGTSRTRSD